MKVRYTVYLYNCQCREWYLVYSCNSETNAIGVMRKHPIAKVVYNPQNNRGN